MKVAINNVSIFLMKIFDVFLDNIKIRLYLYVPKISIRKMIIIVIFIINLYFIKKINQPQFSNYF